ncbi:hypothetical protein VNI00_016330 [Paramarasmius palmivorus]|uniref:GH16 domain-containing protein n=1 Tax=Paramarasmius palmivorus TaxID=297713 RepID=A0AAW0BEF8_9AGAR
MLLQLAALSILAHGISAQTWRLTQHFGGPQFFDGFQYVENATDPANNFGNIRTIGESSPFRSRMTYVDSNGRAIIKVDDETVGNPLDTEFGRNSIYLKSREPMTFGSLIVVDLEHIPYGCSVWPGLFTQGENWPEGGELDLIEGVNLQPRNQYALHTDPDHRCRHTATGEQQTGTTTFAECTADGIDNRGCTVQEASPRSFGSSFAGGAYALAWDEQGIRMWFFERGTLPTGIDNDPDPSQWPTPSAFYPASGCDPRTAFGPQVLTIAINICGKWALPAFGETCGSVASQCVDMVRDPANYRNAYWEINYISIYTSSSSSATPTNTSSTSGPRNTGSAASDSTPNEPQNDGNNAGVSLNEVRLWRYMMTVASLALVPTIAAGLL